MDFIFGLKFIFCFFRFLKMAETKKLSEEEEYRIALGKKNASLQKIIDQFNAFIGANPECKDCQFICYSCNHLFQDTPYDLEDSDGIERAYCDDCTKYCDLCEEIYSADSDEHDECEQWKKGE